MADGMKTFVSGGAGFIGSHLCRRLVDEGHSVTAFDNLHLGNEEFLEPCQSSADFRFVQADLLELDRVVEESKGHDIVFHLAANSDILAGTKNTDVDLKLGTLATYNVLEAMRINDIKKLAFASTSAIYGEADIKPTPESYGPLYPISFYGASKLACEGLVTAFSHNFDMQAWVYRFANIVGPQSTHGILYDFCKKIEKNKDRLQVLGNGTQKKSYLHVRECVDGILFGLKNSNEAFQCFNLASQGVTEVRYIAEEYVKQLGTGTELEFGTEDRGWKSDVPYTWLDGAQLQKLGWKAEMDSDSSVSLAISEVLKERGLI
jgi:UDP-glucose 4-epimerase